MEMLSPDTEMLLAATDGQVRKLKRVEFEALAAEGFFDEERVELLFGMVIPMPPIDPEHAESTEVIVEHLREHLAGRARIRTQGPFAALDDSEPLPDVSVVPLGAYWTAHPERAVLVVEVARSSLRRDRAKRTLYARANVDEYWIINHDDECVEVHREPREGSWQNITRHGRGGTIRPLAFPDVVISVDDILPPT